MGMFDYVHVQIECPDCGTTLNDWQSKDAACCMDVISPEQVDRFYASCDNCGRRVEFSRAKTRDNFTLRDKPYNSTEVTEMGFKLVG